MASPAPVSARARRSASASPSRAKASDSRTARGAVRWLTPTTTIIASFRWARPRSWRAAGHGGREHVHPDEGEGDGGEGGDAEQGRAPASPPRALAGQDQDDVEGPGHDRAPL